MCRTGFPEAGSFAGVYMKRTILTALIITILLLSSCVPGRPPARNFNDELEVQPVKTQFTTEDFLEDYEQLWAVLEENYPYLHVLEERGINVEGLRESNRQVLTTRIKDLKGFLFLLQDTLRRMGNLAHLELWDPLIYRQRVPLFEPDDPRAEILLSPQTVASYDLLDTGTGSASSASETIQFPKVEVGYYPDINAAYFHFASFNHSLVERDKDVIADHLAALGDVDYVIIDITGNQGGSDAYWMQNVVAPFGGEYTSEEYRYLKLTPLIEDYYGRMYPDATFKPLSNLPPDHEVPSIVNEFGMTHFYYRKLTLHAGKTVRTQTKRYVVTDHWNYSAADSFATFCKGTGWATLVGERPKGDGGLGMNPIMLALKNTGLVLCFSATTFVNCDGTLNAVIGTPPDIACMGKETPLKACLRAIVSEYD